jgi:hypothetical protein
LIDFMTSRTWLPLVLSGLFLLSLCGVACADFIRPMNPGDPLIYGVRNGICVAMYPNALDGRPMGGPRGLIRVGFQEEGTFHLLNYIAVQPTVHGATGLSELERGGDGMPGKPFRVGSRLADGGNGANGDVRGVVHQMAQGAVLTVFLYVEMFANGAAPVIEVSLYENQPDRVQFRTFSGDGGSEMQRCDLSATMGNQSRCRALWLDASAIYAPDLYAGYRGDGFVEHAPYRLNTLHKTTAGDVVVAISPDEFDPREVWPFGNGAWHHDGIWMAQFWLKPQGSYDESLQCRVNGRGMYWGGNSPIPGGLAYENFELQETFRSGQEIWFGYRKESPAKTFGFGYDAAPTAAPLRTVSPAETSILQSAMSSGRQLTNGDFSNDLTGWETEGGADQFHILRSASETALTTYGANKEADRGRLYQCFEVPVDATELQFMQSGGADSPNLYVALWDGDHLARKMTARNDNTPFRVHWNVEALRGKFVTLEIVDNKAGPWGFIAAEGFTFAP